MFGFGRKKVSVPAGQSLNIPLVPFKLRDEDIESGADAEREFRDERLASLTEVVASEMGCDSVEEAIATINDEFNENIEWIIERDAQVETRDEWLRRTEAIVTPMAVHALVVALAEKQGVELFMSGHERYAPYNNVMPTRAYSVIPENYGADGLEVTVLADVVDQDSYRSSEDERSGWEYGHTTAHFVFAAKGDAPRLVTNAYSVATCKEIEDFRRGKSINELVSLISGFQAKIGQSITQAA